MRERGEGEVGKTRGEEEQRKNGGERFIDLFAVAKKKHVVFS